MTNKIYTAQEMRYAAKMREALEKADAVFERIFSPDGFIDISYAETREVTEARNEIKAAISAPPRNCDRPECATTKEAQEVWRKEDGERRRTTSGYYQHLRKEV